MYIEGTTPQIYKIVDKVEQVKQNFDEQIELQMDRGGITFGDQWGKELEKIKNNSQLWLKKQVST